MNSSHFGKTMGKRGNEASGIRTALGILSVALTAWMTAIPAPSRAAGYWTATEVRGNVVYVTPTSKAPKPVTVGLDLPPGTFIQTRAGGSVVFRSGDDEEAIPPGHGRTLRRTDAPGFTLPATTPIDRVGQEREESNPDEFQSGFYGGGARNANDAKRYYQDRLDGLIAKAEAGVRERDSANEGTRSIAAGKPGAPGAAPKSNAPLAGLTPQQAQAVLRGESVAAAPATGQTDRTDRTDRSPEPAAAASVAGTRSTNAIPRDHPSPTAVAGSPPETDIVASGRLQITWPPSRVSVVSAPTVVRLAWSQGVTPRSLVLRTEGVELLRVPLASGDREVALPELGVMIQPNASYDIAVEWSGPEGIPRETAAVFALVSEARRARMRQDLTYLYEALGPLWNGREGLMLRASVFADYNCQGEAAELLLRYSVLAPEDRQAYALLHQFFRTLGQPDRADAALVLAAQ